jgi:D-psicose/D-tagatose/L-ribulose 3-epimerase
MTMVKMGVCTWTFGDLALEEIARRVAELGFDGIGLLGDPERYPAHEAKQVLDGFGLSVMAVTPRNVDLAHPDKAIRDRALDYYFRLVDWAAEFGSPLIGCHNYVGRTEPLASLSLEGDLFAGGVARIAGRAQACRLRLVLEALNRYESHLVNTAGQAVALTRILEKKGSTGTVGILLDAYHMNIEESNPAGAIRQAGERLWLYHAADSNRQGIGRGHIDFTAQVGALHAVGYDGPVILECTPPGADPFAPDKESPLYWLELYYRESRQWLLENWR